MSEGKGGIKIDLGVGEAARTILEAPGIVMKGIADATKYKYSRLNLQQALKDTQTLREVSSYIQKLRFVDDGLRHRLSQFARHPNWWTAMRLKTALQNTASTVITEHDKFQELWEDEDTRLHVRAENSELSELIERAESIKRLIWEGRLKPMSWRERVPFVRRERYRRLARTLSELESEFDQVNERSRTALNALDSILKAYKDRIDELTAGTNKPKAKED